MGSVVMKELNYFTKEVDVRRVITCSWCHEVNDRTQRPALCKRCEHRADLPRLECDCRRCLDPRVGRSSGPARREIG